MYRPLNIIKIPIALIIGLGFCIQSFADTLDDMGEESLCLQRSVLTASAEMTVAQLRRNCRQMAQANEDPIDTEAERRLVSQQLLAKDKFTLLQHENNYFLPVAYNFKSEKIDPFSIPGNARELDANEFKFQLSFKSLLWDTPFGTQANLYAAYTNTSWWQAYNRNESSPFRETNHQPELFVDYPGSLSIAGWDLANWRTGISHSSNGRSGEFSRSWNRLYTEFLFLKGDHELLIKPWATVSDVEDNPDIDDFHGKFELRGRHHLGRHDLGWRIRHTLDDNNKGSARLDWSFPIAGREDLKFFMQYFDGYGESLIDYNRKSRRLGIGFKLGG